MVQCWLMDTDAGQVDPRGECHKKPKEFVPVEKLAAVGVFYRKIEAADRDRGLDAISAERGYANRDEVIVSREKLANYDEKLKSFYEEHLHLDEEVRYMVGGDGYFDIRDEEDRWVRIHTEEGDLIILPAGIYHRFTLSSRDFVHTIRLFKDEPSWTPFNRGPEADNMPARVDYLSRIISAE